MGSDAERLVERLLGDADFRARFEADPSEAAREAGFDALADHLEDADGNSMQTLELRESKSSLAGALMAAAAEGLALWEFGGHAPVGAPRLAPSAHPVPPAPSGQPAPPADGPAPSEPPAARPAARPAVQVAHSPAARLAARAEDVSRQRANGARASGNLDDLQGNADDEDAGADEQDGSDENEPDENEPDENGPDGGDDGTDDDSDAPGEGSNGEDASDDSGHDSGSHNHAGVLHTVEPPHGSEPDGILELRAGITKDARSFVGTPYVWGGTTPSGFDCSGFVQYVYHENGVDLPRVSYQQADSGQRLPLQALKPGDLVAWDNSSRNDGADHIAIYLGHGQIAEAPSPGINLRIRDLGSDEGAWGVRILGHKG
jgi:hypothetical protein